MDAGKQARDNQGDVLYKTEGGEGVIHAEQQVKSLGVDRIWQRLPGIQHPNSACGPVSAAMIVNYLYAQGYAKGLSEKERNSQIQLGESKIVRIINLFWQQMAWYWGTGMERYRSTLEGYLNEKLSGKWHIELHVGDKFLIYKQAIDAGFPVIIRFNNLFSRRGVFARWHFVVGDAYLIQDGVQYVGVKDPDRGAKQTGTFFFPWETNAPYLSLGILKHDSEERDG